MKKFLNDPEAAVDEALEGFIGVHSRHVRLLETARVVARVTPVEGKVGVISGGGSGHKPAFVGFVGDGLLDAVAVGDIFTSPTAGTALEAIRAADTGAGVLFLLGNYAGDVMNFTMAAEMARAEGRDVELTIVTDDVGGGFHKDPAKRRGVVGSVLMWKACGAMAAKGAALADVKRIAEKVNARVRSTGVAIGTCTVPAAGQPTFVLGEREMEVGVGLHGDRGVATVEISPVDDIVGTMLEAIIQDLPFLPGSEVVTMINGFGATPLLELYVAQRGLRRALDSRGIGVARSYVGEYITVLEAAGFSITLLDSDEELKELIAAPADSPHFVQF